MAKLKIFISVDSERIDDESKESGFRGDINVEIDGKNYHLFVYNIVSFMQEVERDITDHQFYDFMPNMIIVPEVTKENIIFTINKLYDNGFFERLTPQENIYYPKKYQINES